MDVFAALADPVRRDLVRRLASGPARVVDLAAEHPISRPAISKHLRLLTEAGLASAEDRGRERHYRLDRTGLSSVRDFLAELRPRAAVQPTPTSTASTSRYAAPSATGAPPPDTPRPTRRQHDHHSRPRTGRREERGQDVVRGLHAAPSAAPIDDVWAAVHGVGPARALDRHLDG